MKGAKYKTQSRSAASAIFFSTLLQKKAAAADGQVITHFGEGLRVMVVVLNIWAGGSLV